MDTTEDLLQMARHNILRMGNPDTDEAIAAQAQAYLLMAIVIELKRHNDRIDGEIEQRETMNMAESLEKLGW